MSSLQQFHVGQRVLFKCDKKCSEWFEGKVTQVNTDTCTIQQWVSLCDPVSNNEPPMMEPGQIFTVPKEDDGQMQIRVQPHEKSFMDKLFEATYKPPTFKDPFAHLYMNHNVDSVMVGNKKFGTTQLQIEMEQLIHIVNDPNDIYIIIGEITNRRNTSNSPDVNIGSLDPVKIVSSLLPKQQSSGTVDLNALREKAQYDSKAMLQLADITHYGLCGVAKDISKALPLYNCAAWGISEEENKKRIDRGFEVDSTFMYPLGTPEALCAVATMIWNRVCDEVGTRNFDFVVQLTQQSTVYMFLVKLVVFYLAHAIRREWYCPLALAVGQSLRDAQFCDSFLPGGFNMIEAIEVMQAIDQEMPPDLLNKLGLPASHKFDPDDVAPMAQPSKEQLEMFYPKATKIFLDLPVKVLTPGLIHSNIHVEYVPMSFPPYPVIVFVINPIAEYVHNSVTLLDELQYIPYSQNAFEKIWGEIVFSLHRGDSKGKMRQRPPLITFADRPGDRRLANYIQSRIGNDTGTEIRVVRTREYKVQQGRHSRSISDITTHIKESMNKEMKERMGVDSADMRTPIELSDGIDLPIEDLLLDVERLKDEGNSFFVQGRFHLAQKCYTEAINKIQISTNVDHRVQKMLGTLLSNRAACFLKTSENMSPDTAKTALMKAVDDCDIAQKLSRVIPRNIVAKIERRKNDALKRIGEIESQESKWYSSRYCNVPHENGLDERRQETSQQVSSSSTQNNRRRNNRSRRNRRRNGRRRNRNRNRNQRNNDVDVNENNNETDLHDDVEMVQILPGETLLDSQFAEFITESEDPCPCCFDRFRVELANTHTAVLPCSHACCLPCLSDLKKKSNRTRDPIPFTCPICRFPIPEKILDVAADSILENTNSIEERLALLPLRELESEHVAKMLMKVNDFKIGAVLRSLDAMLTDSLQTILRKSQKLTPDEKQKIYEEYRNPIDELFSELDQKRTNYALMRDVESDEAKKLSARIEELQSKLIPEARKFAMDSIWERVNIGSMGHENELGEVEVDFHALHINEAKDQFDKRVLPVLEALGSILLIVGRGNNSEGNIPKLRPALQRHIEKHPKKRFMRHETVAGNEGAIRALPLHPQ